MQKNKHMPFATELVAEFMVLAICGIATIWVAQDIVVKALRFVLPDYLG